MRKRDLHLICKGFLAESLANGTINVLPIYREPAGVLTRLTLAQHIKKVLNADYRRSRKRK